MNVIAATVGKAIAPDAPTVTGTVSNYSANPALPSGLTLDNKTGTISGTPTAASPKTTYTITASNSGGSTSAQLTITVAAPPKAFLELGHGIQIVSERLTVNRLLSEDRSGHWVLWDYSTAAIVASGDGALTPQSDPYNPTTVNDQIDMVGQVAVVATSSGLQVYATSNGHLLFTIPNPVWWKLATDGSYIATGTASALTVWSPAGQVELTRTGDYRNAIAFAAPTQIQMSKGPSGANVIETVSIPSGAFSVSPSFQGGFSRWFQDGESFITTLPPVVWIYSKAGILQTIMSLPSISSLGGTGNWMWTFTAYPEGALRIYSIGSANPVATYQVGSYVTIVNDRTFIGVFGNYSPPLFVFDLTGPAPSETVYDLSLTAFAGLSSKNWVGGGSHGSVLDGSNLPASSRYFGYGAVLGIVGNSNQVVLSTSIGKTLLFDTQGPNKIAELGIPAGTLSMSSDGTTLAAAVNGLSVYSLPSGTLLSNFPHSNDVLFNFSLSGSGTALGQTTGVYSNGSWSYRREVTGISGSPLIWSDTGFNTPLLLSPDVHDPSYMRFGFWSEWQFAQPELHRHWLHLVEGVFSPARPDVHPDVRQVRFPG
jgi:hypothetical protein